jgi:UDP-N-acetyl-D-galactosamine dehydrogenase
MGNIIARRVVRFLAQGTRPVHEARVGVLGLTFKENVPDIRNSRVPDILTELNTFGIKPVAHDPLASPEEVGHEYGLTLERLPRFKDLDALILAVPHRQYLEKPGKLTAMLREGGVLVDIKSTLDPKTIPGNLRYWSL